MTKRNLDPEAYKTVEVNPNLQSWVTRSFNKPVKAFKKSKHIMHSIRKQCSLDLGVDIRIITNEQMAKAFENNGFKVQVIKDGNRLHYYLNVKQAELYEVVTWEHEQREENKQKFMASDAGKQWLRKEKLKKTSNTYDSIDVHDNNSKYRLFKLIAIVIIILVIYDFLFN